MFYDPTCKPAKADPFTLESLITWLEKQPAKLEYDFWCTQCCLGNYFTASGYQVLMVGTGTFTTKDGTRIDLPPGFNGIAQTRPHTYGAALERARAAAR